MLSSHITIARKVQWWLSWQICLIPLTGDVRKTVHGLSVVYPLSVCGWFHTYSNKTQDTRVRFKAIAHAPIARVCGLCSSVDHHIDLYPSLQQSGVNEQPKAYAAIIYNRANSIARDNFMLKEVHVQI